MKVQSCLKMTCLLLLITPAAWAQSLGTTNLLEGPAAGSDSVVLAAASAWTATANDSWLHLSAANQSGTGSANVIFAFDANSGATRTGTLAIAGQTVAVTQAGATYIAITQPTTLVSTGLYSPSGVAVDSMGNVYIADYYNMAIKEWLASSNTVTMLVRVNWPYNVAVDGSDNVYFTSSGNNVIMEWVAASNTVIRLVDSLLIQPGGVAVDSTGNVIFTDTVAVKEWLATSNTVTTLVSAIQLIPGGPPSGVAVDVAGNVYVVGHYSSAMKEWFAASNTVTTLVSSGLNYPNGVAVDGSGNVYIADTGNNAIKEWVAAINTVNTLVSSGLNRPHGVAVDGSGNVFIADSENNAIKELPHAFVDATAKTEPASGGSDMLPTVLPATANLTGPFAPVCDSPWLTITGVTNGVVSFAFSANPSATSRTANITVLGMAVAVTQSASPLLTEVAILNNGAFQFGFSNNQSASYTVWTTTNLSLPLTNWTLLGPPESNGSGQYQFTDPAATNDVRRFYRVTSP